MALRQYPHRITIQRPTTNKDQYKRASTDWEDYITTWASVEPLRGREYFMARGQGQSLAQNVNFELTARIRLRYVEGVWPGMRVIYDGSRVFNIESAIDVRERHKELHLMCFEINPGVNDA
jgi:SPP1 family predicted phage head-tail adaptor